MKAIRALVQCSNMPDSEQRYVPAPVCSDILPGRKDRPHFGRDMAWIGGSRMLPADFTFPQASPQPARYVAFLRVKQTRRFGGKLPSRS
jgi:hypothetical protein